MSRTKEKNPCKKKQICFAVPEEVERTFRITCLKMGKRPSSIVEPWIKAFNRKHADKL